jgi:hypothetical protein
MFARSSLIAVLVVLLLGPVTGGAAAQDTGYGRPYFMPGSERARIQHLLTNQTWARNELERISKLAKSDGYWAALLYVLEGDESDLAIAKNWLLQYGNSGGDLGERALKANDDFFKQGQPWLGDVYYGIDDRPLIAYDWIYSALNPRERDAIESGIFASARFRMRAILSVNSRIHVPAHRQPLRILR